jgi:heme-degrading monooxygenase HmoA
VDALKEAILMTTTITDTDAASVEVALFRLRPGVDEAAFLRASAAIAPAVRAFGGFRRRTLYKSEDGRWVDLVDWDSLADAQRAAEAALTSPACQPFLAMIDPADDVMIHARPVRRYDAPPAEAGGVVELHLARLNPGVTDEALLRAADGIMPDARAMDGYLGRQVLKADDGRWIDVIAWRDRAAAVKAGEAFLALPSARPLLAAIDPESITAHFLQPAQRHE